MIKYSFDHYQTDLNMYIDLIKNDKCQGNVINYTPMLFNKNNIINIKQKNDNYSRFINTTINYLHDIIMHKELIVGIVVSKRFLLKNKQEKETLA